MKLILILQLRLAAYAFSLLSLDHISIFQLYCSVISATGQWLSSLAPTLVWEYVNSVDGRKTVVLDVRT